MKPTELVRPLAAGIASFLEFGLKLRAVFHLAASRSLDCDWLPGEPERSPVW